MEPFRCTVSVCSQLSDVRYCMNSQPECSCSERNASDMWLAQASGTQRRDVSSSPHPAPRLEGYAAVTWTRVG
eukprot:102477-Rhodomonas_salina.1